jgi:hypothetical protein
LRFDLNGKWRCNCCCAWKNAPKCIQCFCPSVHGLFNLGDSLCKQWLHSFGAVHT